MRKDGGHFKGFSRELLIVCSDWMKCSGDWQPGTLYSRMMSANRTFRQRGSVGPQLIMRDVLVNTWRVGLYVTSWSIRDELVYIRDELVYTWRANVTSTKQRHYVDQQLYVRYNSPQKLKICLMFLFSFCLQLKINEYKLQHPPSSPPPILQPKLSLLRVLCPP